MGNTEETSGSQEVSTRQQQIAELARQKLAHGITSLNHHLDQEWMREAWRRTRKDGAAGVDGETADRYEQNLEENLADLLERAKSGRYFAPPVKRAYIPKGKDQFRPIGIPTLEDKVLQRAWAMLLEPVFEEEFSDCSYGFRPKRKAQDALQAMDRVLWSMGGGWIIDADIEKYFDTVDRRQLQEFVQKRVRDGVVRRIIGKWLQAGVMEDGQLRYPDEGTPQGGVISPLLSNVYLHEVLDCWWEQEVQPRLSGRSDLFRFADDFVMVFEREEDARRVMQVLAQRFARYGLRIHPDKTRLVDFRRPGPGASGETFDFLGFRHYWGKSRKGRLIPKRKTASPRLSQKLNAIAKWCRAHRHDPVKQQQATLVRKLQGHYNYYGLTHNYPGLKRYYRGVCRVWRKWLNRRSRKRDLSWEAFNRLLKRYPLPLPHVVHTLYPRTGESPS
ncbi:MAG: group II intron reverse transcriptase/maturase [Akkermansiaceae bacterium]|nr:group II intron reverse transcriptase/maturase [Akkermansiaceae bacterium]